MTGFAIATATKPTVTSSEAEYEAELDEEMLPYPPEPSRGAEKTWSRSCCFFTVTVSISDERKIWLCVVMFVCHEHAGVHLIR